MSHHIQLSDGRTITITPPTGAKLVKAQVWFGLRFMRLRDHPPTEEVAQRRMVTKIARALAPYVRGITPAELVRGGEGVSAWLKETPALFQGLVGGVQGAIPFFQDLIAVDRQIVDALASGDLSDAIGIFTGAIQAAAPVVLDAVLSWGEALVDWIAPYVPPMLDALGAAVDSAWGWVQQQAPEWIAQLGVWGAALGEWVAPYIPVAIKALGDLVDAAWGWVQQQAPIWGQQLKTWGNELVDWIAPMIPPAIDALSDLGQHFLVWVGDQAAPLLTRFQDWGKSFVAWIPGATVTFLAQWPGMLNQFLDWIGAAAGPLLKQLGEWAVSFIGWIVPMIPPFLLALGGVALALGTFVVETAAVLGVKLLQWAKSFEDWVKVDVLPKLPGWLHTIDEAMWAWADTAKDAILGKMADVGASLVDGLTQGVSSAWSGFKDYLRHLADGLPDWFKDWWGINSPAKEFLPIGSSVVEGLMQGIENMIPALKSLVADLSDDLVKQVADIASQVQGGIADAFGATASIDRQIASNLDKFKDIPDAYRQYTTGALQQAQNEAQAMADPAEGAKFFALRSKQILEYAKLQQDLAEAETQEDRDRISAQMILVNRAQEAELSGFDANLKATTSGVEQLMADIQDLLSNTDLPGILESSAVASLTSILRQLAEQGTALADSYAHPTETMADVPRSNGSVSPPASPAQQQSWAAGNQSFDYSRHVSMPIYTNNSPGVLQQSMAIAQAGMI